MSAAPAAPPLRRLAYQPVPLSRGGPEFVWARVIGVIGSTHGKLRIVANRGSSTPAAMTDSADRVQHRSHRAATPRVEQRNTPGHKPLARIRADPPRAQFLVRSKSAFVRRFLTAGLRLFSACWRRKSSSLSRSTSPTHEPCRHVVGESRSLPALLDATPAAHDRISQQAGKDGSSAIRASAFVWSAAENRRAASGRQADATSPS